MTTFSDVHAHLEIVARSVIDQRDMLRDTLVGMNGDCDTFQNKLLETRAAIDTSIAENEKFRQQMVARIEQNLANLDALVGVEAQRVVA